MFDSHSTPLVIGFIGGLRDWAVIGLASDGRVIAWNEGGRAILGHEAGDIVGRHVSCLYPDPRRAASDLDAALAQGRHEERGLRVRSDGSELLVHSVLMPVRDPTAGLLGFGNLLTAESAALGKLNARAHMALRERILVVDDDHGVRDVTARRLASLGYRVATAANATDALAVIGGGTEIDLLLTDVMMPGDMHGAELAREARALRPGLRVLFTSGYLEDALIRNQALEGGTAFLIKPFSKAELAAKLRDVLGEGADGAEIGRARRS